MKRIMIICMLVTSINAWETTTHRAIDKTAISNAHNLTSFLTTSGLKNYTFNRNSIGFEGYGMTYIEYVIDGEGDSGISQWNQTFSNRSGSTARSKELIEAGTILEDALWQDEDTIAFGGDGRFNNHFYEAQNNGHKLTYGYGFHVNAVDWATDLHVPTANPNLYNYPRAMRYFCLGFTESDPKERRKYQAKMLVSVGHLMHMVNDMNVPAHVRDDAHPLTDPLEVWMRGGWDGDKTDMGFHVMGSQIKGNISGKVNTTYKRSTVADFMTSEASYTSRNFLSASTLNLNSSYKPNTSTISYSQWYQLGGGVSKRYMRNADKTKIALELKSHICDNLITLGVPRGRGLCGNSVIKGDYSVLKESGQVLIKRAISNATGFVNYFFRGQIEAKITRTTIAIKNISDTSLVGADTTIMRSTSSSGGAYIVMYENDDGTRHPLYFTYDRSKGNSDIADNLTQPNNPTNILYPSIDLNPENTLSAHIILDYATDQIVRNKKIIIIYSGKIGEEEGASICTADSPSGMTATRI